MRSIPLAIAAPLRGFVILAATTMLLTSVVAAAELNDWTTIGPEGGSIQGLAIDPSTPTTLYAATEGGVLKSTDAGATWVAANVGLTSLAVDRIVIDPATPTTLYTASIGGGVFKSTDGGATWSARNVGLGTAMSALAIDPANPAILYGRSSTGIVKTTNGAASWVPSNTGLPPALNTTGIAVDPLTPGTVYAAMRGSGVYKSTDAGATWGASNGSLTDLDVFAFALDPAAPGTLYAGTCGSTPTRGVFKSLDGGATWAPANSGLDPTPCIDTLAVDPTAPGVVYVATIDGGTFKSVDAGATWVPRNVGIEGRRIVDFAVDPATSATVYAASIGGGIFKTTDAGATWAATNAGVHAYDVASFAFDPTSPGTIYLGTYSDEPSETVFRSTDGGTTWTRRGPEPADQSLFPEFGVTSLAVDPTNAATIYAGTDSGVFKTIDGGATWIDPPSLVYISALIIDPTSPSTVYAGSSDSGILKSTDSGASWSEMNAGLTDTSVAALVMDPSRPKVLYAGTDAGVFRTTNGAKTWISWSQGIGAVSVIALAIDPTDRNLLYAGSGASSPLVYKSTDGGTSWTSLGNHGRLAAIVVDPLHSGSVYAAGNGGVSKSVDAGVTWTSLNASLPDKTVDALALDPQQAVRVYAGTRGTSAFRTQALCAVAADCHEDDLCITDTCAPGDAAADARGCVSQPVVCDAQCHAQPGFCNSGTGLCEYASPAFPDGTSCDDDDPCTFDRCLAGVCSGNPTPQIGCQAAPSSRLSMKDRVGNGDVLGWSWSKGSASVASFANPLTGARYTLCVYDHSGAGGSSSLIMQASTPADDICAGVPCWRATASGFKYRDRTAASDGLARIRLKTGIGGRAKIILNGKGVNLRLPVLPLTPGVVVQLARTHGLFADACWESDFSTGILRNDVRQFKARID